MSIIKIAHREQNYLVVQKDCLNEKSLSWGARGIHSYLMGKPSDWRVMVQELINSSPHGKHAIYGFLNELIAAGYIKRVRETEENGRVKQYVYIVYETRQEPDKSEKPPLPKKQEVEEKPLPDFRDPAKPLPENQPLPNNDLTKDLNNQAAEKAAANFEIICNKLSEVQKDIIKTRLAENKKFLREFTNEQWLNALNSELLDEASFKNAKQIFSHKLNIILQQIKKGKWSPAIAEAKTSIDKQEKATTDLNRIDLEINHLKSIKSGIMKTISLYRDGDNAKKSFEKELGEIDVKLEHLTLWRQSVSEQINIGV